MPAVAVLVENPDGQRAEWPDFLYEDTAPHPLAIPWPDGGQADWRKVLPTTPSAGYTTGLGYPEPRFIVISQWHDSNERDLDHMRHIHNEVAWPRVVRTDTLLLEQRALNFHWFGGTFESFRKVVQRNWVGGEILPCPLSEDKPGVFKVAIPEDSTGHLREFYGPTLLDLRSIGPTPRWVELESDVQSIRPDGLSAQTRFIKLFFWADITNTGAEPTLPIPRFGSEGWVGAAQLGYTQVLLWGMQQFDTDPKPASFKLLPHGPIGAELQVKVMLNPNLHRHDVVQPDGSLGPDYGTILFEKTFIMPTQMKDRDAFDVPHPLMRPGDKVLARVAIPNESQLGAVAQLGGWVMGKGA